MIPVAQTMLGPTSGDCFRACVASVLELPIEEVPHFCSPAVMAGGVGWWAFFLDWCWLRGIEVLCFWPDHGDRPRWWSIRTPSYGAPGTSGSPVPPPGYSILTGLSPRNHATGGMHAVVCLDGVLAHDPRADDPRGVLSAYEWMRLIPSRRRRVPPRAESDCADALSRYSARQYRRLQKGEITLRAYAEAAGVNPYHVIGCHDFFRRERRTAP